MTPLARGRALCPAFLAISLGACAGGGGLAPAAVPQGAAADPLSAPVASRMLPMPLGTFVPRVRVELAHPEVEVRIDEILSSPVLADPDFERAVGAWVDYWKGPAGRALPDFLGRMSAFETLVDSALAVNGLPPSLRYLPFIESGYNPMATSRARAVGMWQFMEGTARGRGLEVSGLVDQRRDPVRSTEEAIAFLAELRDELGSWFWALAAYNGGPNRAQRIQRTHGQGAEPSDSLFWALRHHFPRETQDFVPKLFGAMLVASDPAAHDVEPRPADPFRFDEVTVPDATTLDVVARAAGVPLADVERLNPHYVRRMTPPGRRSSLRVPEGTGRDFEVAYAALPPEERVTFVMHRISSGETLSHIARLYGVRVADLEAANPGIRPRYLRVGRTLTVPVAPSARRTSVSGG